MPYTQENRLISLDTPLGDDKLLLAGFSGHEAISRLFSFHLDLLAEQGPIEFSDIIGKSVTITINQSDDTERRGHQVPPLPDGSRSLDMDAHPLRRLQNLPQ
jgi:type VI secretion system secreted protein VgrG